MHRNLYALAASLFAFSLISCGITLIPTEASRHLPGNAVLWRTTGSLLLVGALLSAIFGILTALFEQVDRRTEERRGRKRRNL